jgi:hypothetical protein
MFNNYELIEKLLRITGLSDKKVTHFGISIHPEHGVVVNAQIAMESDELQQLSYLLDQCTATPLTEVAKTCT